MNQSIEKVTVVCKGCGATEKFPSGYLTMEAEKKFRCKICREDVVENQAQERAIGGRQVLID